MNLWISCGAIFVLLVLSAFFSGSETAMTAASKARLHGWEKEGNKKAALVNKIRLRKDKLIGGLLLGNNLVNILASALATSLFVRLFGDAGVVYATVIMTALIVIFSEILPKTYAILNADRTALAVAPVLRVTVALLAPVAAAAQFVVRRTFKLLGSSIDDSQDILSAREELRGAIHLHHLEGAVVKGDRDMLGGILDLRELEVSDLMVHRTKMQSIDIDRPVKEIVERVLESGHTRLPAWRDNPDNIVGVLHAKDLLRAIHEAGGEADAIDVAGICASPWFVPDTTGVIDQLNAFLKRKSHFALVVDEYGEVMGLITLEDILEEIVGDIVDEHDIVHTGIRQLQDGSVFVEGATPIRDLNRVMDWDLPDTEATTIAGLVIHEARMIPDVGQAFTFHGYRFQVLRRKRHQITALRVTPLRAVGSRSA